MITVYGRRSSINVQKVLWAIAETGVAFERVTLGGAFGGTDTRDYRKLNPNGLVPAIRDGSISMFESNAIVRYLARRYGRDSIRPRGNKAWALADQWMDWAITTPFVPLSQIFWNKVRQPPEQYNDKLVKVAESNIAAHFKLVNRMLGRRTWLAGRHFSCGDIPLGAMYWRYKNLDIDRPRLKHLDRWYAQLQERSAYREWVMVPFGRNQAEWNAYEQQFK
jgi:glutathione S-transferase